MAFGSDSVANALVSPVGAHHEGRFEHLRQQQHKGPALLQLCGWTTPYSSIRAYMSTDAAP
jgi:hypothetical protein